MTERDRFDQKFNMYYQGEWKPELSYLNRDSKYKSMHRLLEEGASGYSGLDHALQRGAGAVLRALAVDINRANHGGNEWADERAVTRQQMTPAEAAQAVKAAAALFGADDVGTCRLRRQWIYSHYYDPECRQSYPIHFSDEDGYSAYSNPGLAKDGALIIPADMASAIMLVVEMDFVAMETAPALPAAAATAAAYSKLAFTVTALAEFIRSLGYKAIPSLNCTGLNIPLVIEAGLGRLGRNGLLLHPRFGPRCRIAKIITNLPFPEGTPAADYLQDFCVHCNKCAVNCPAQAISFGEPSDEPLGDFSLAGTRKWQVNYQKCREYWVKSGTNCGVCIAVCTFNRKGRQSRLQPPDSYWQT